MDWIRGSSHFGILFRDANDTIKGVGKKRPKNFEGNIQGVNLHMQLNIMHLNGVYEK